jgi:hypothetical protein
MSQSRLHAQGRGEGRPTQLPLILMLNGYAIVGALFVSRAILHALEISGRYWVGRQIFRATDPFASILELFPGGSSIVTGQMTVADLTLVLAVILFPLGILAFGGRGRSSDH